MTKYKYVLDDGSTYEIPQKEVDNFELSYAKKSPKRVYNINNAEYQVPISERKAFEYAMKIGEPLTPEQQKDIRSKSKVFMKEERKLAGERLAQLPEEERRQVQTEALGKAQGHASFFGRSAVSGLLGVTKSAVGITQAITDPFGGIDALDSYAKDLNAQTQALGTPPEGSNLLTNLTGEALQSLPTSLITIGSVFAGAGAGASLATGGGKLATAGKFLASAKGGKLLTFMSSAISAGGSSYAEGTGTEEGVMRYIDSAVSGGISGATEAYLGELGNIKGMQKAFAGMSKEAIRKNIKSSLVKFGIEQAKGSGGEFAEEFVDNTANALYDLVRGKREYVDGADFAKTTLSESFRAGISGGFSALFQTPFGMITSSRTKSPSGKEKVKLEKVKDKKKAKETAYDQLKSLRKVETDDPTVTPLDIDKSIDIIENMATIPETREGANLELVKLVNYLNRKEIAPNNAEIYNMRLEKIGKDLDIKSGREVNPAESYTLVTPNQRTVKPEPKQQQTPANAPVEKAISPQAKTKAPEPTVPKKRVAPKVEKSNKPMTVKQEKFAKSLRGQIMRTIRENKVSKEQLNKSMVYSGYGESLKALDVDQLKAVLEIAKKEVAPQQPETPPTEEAKPKEVVKPVEVKKEPKKPEIKKPVKKEKQDALPKEEVKKQDEIVEAKKPKETPIKQEKKTPVKKEVLVDKKSIKARKGAETTRSFGRDVEVKGSYAILDIGEVQPSHIKGQRNLNHSIPEAQPKERDMRSSQVAMENARTKDPTALLKPTADPYSGAPTVNSRGDVIQGNNRAESIGYVYSENPKQAKIYKDYLIENAKELGLTRDQIESVDNPVLVNMLDISDEDAIRLGNLTSVDLETGGVRDIDAYKTWRKASKENKGKLTKKINGYFESNEDSTIGSIVRNNATKIADFLNKSKMITIEEFEGLFSKGKIGKKGMSSIYDIVIESTLSSVPTSTRNKFLVLPEKIQTAIVKIKNSKINEVIENNGYFIDAIDEFYNGDYPSWQSFSDEIDITGAIISDKVTPTEELLLEVISKHNTSGFNKAFGKLLSSYAQLTKTEETIFGKKEGLFPLNALSVAINNNDLFSTIIKARQIESEKIAYKSPKIKKMNIRKVDVIAKKQKPEILEGIYRNNIIKGFQESGNVDFIGRTVLSGKDLYQLFQIHRSPYIEKTHIVYMKGSKIVGNTAFTSNLQSTTAVPSVSNILSNAKEVGASSCYIIHNHPSGNPTPSRADLSATATIIRGFGDELTLKGHMVMDHTQYSLITPKTIKTKKGYSKQSAGKPSVNFYRSETKIGKSSVAFNIGKAILEYDDTAGVIFKLTGDNRLMGYEVFPKNATLRDIAKTIDRFCGSVGGNTIIVHKDNYDLTSLKFYGTKVLEVVSVPVSGKPTGFAPHRYKNEGNYVQLWEGDLSYKPSQEAINNIYYKEIYDAFNKVGMDMNFLDYWLMSTYQKSWADINKDNYEGILSDAQAIIDKVDIGQVDLMDRGYKEVNIKPNIEGVDAHSKKSIEPMLKKRINRLGRKFLANPKTTVKLTAVQKFYGLFTDIGEYLSAETGDQRLSKLVNTIDYNRKIVEAEGANVVKKVKDIGQHIKSKEDELLVGAFIQKLDGWELIMDKPDLYRAARDMKKNLDATKGIITVSRIYNAVSGVIVPSNQTFYTKQQKEQIDILKSQLGGYWKNQVDWERLFINVEAGFTKEDFADMDIEFDPSVFVVEDYLPQFNHIQDALVESIQNDTALEDEFKKVESQASLRKERVRKGDKQAQSEVLNLYAKTLIRAHRFKYLDRHVREYHRLARTYLDTADMKLLNNSLRHVLGQYEQGVLTKVFSKIAGFYYKHKIVTRGTLQVKNLFQQGLAIEGWKDIPRILKAYNNPAQQIQDNNGEGYLTRVKFQTNQRSSMEEMYKFQSSVAEMINNDPIVKKNRSYIAKKAKSMLDAVMYVENKFADTANAIHQASDAYNRMMAMSSHLEKATNAWNNNKGDLDGFLRDITFSRFPEAKQLHLLRTMDTNGIEEFIHQFAYTRTRDNHFEYDRAMNSLYDNVENVLFRMTLQYTKWARGYSRNLVGGVANLLKQGETKKATELIVSTSAASIAVSAILGTIFGRLDEYLELDSLWDVLQKALEKLTYKSDSFGLDTLVPLTSPYSIKRYLEGEPDLAGETSNIMLGATGKETYNILNSLYKGMSYGSSAVYYTAKGEEHKVDRKAQQSAREFLGALDQLSQWLAVGRIGQSAYNLSLDKPYWKSRALESAVFTREDRARVYKQKYNSIYQKFIYLISGMKGERVKKSSKKKSK